MYVSLKWKAVVFLSLVLIGITTTWTWQTIVKQVDTFNAELRQTYNNNDALLTELISDSFLKLSQFSQLLSSKQIVSDTVSQPEKKQALAETLERQWLDFNINLGLDYLAVYDKASNKIGEAYSSDLTFIQEFEDTLDQQLALSSQQNEPISYIYCNQACLMVVLEPFINENGDTGTIALAQNMADIVRVYYDFTQSEIGVLIEKSTRKPGNYQINKRHLNNWHMYSWATSNFNVTFPVIRAYSEKSPLSDNQEYSLFDYRKSKYLIKPHSTEDFFVLGHPMHFISVADKTAMHDLMNTNINRGITTGILGLIIAEIILLFLINTPMKKLRNVTEALHLLPKQNFDQVIDKVSHQKQFILDELTILEDSTAYVAKELSKLHKEINLKNMSLKEQIDALTRSRSFLTRLFDNSQIFIITQDFGGAINSTNKKFDVLYKTPPENFERLIYQERELETFRDKCEQLRSKRRDVFQQEIHLLDKNDKNLVIAWTHTLVEDEQGNEIILSIGMDQTKQKKAENDLRWIADHDSLTGIGNRRAFNKSIEKFVQSEAEGALVFIDVNRFKQINDIYGHNIGDQVLTDIANKLRTYTRDNDKISRFAGDEFTVLLTNTSFSTLPNVLEKLSRELNCSIETNDGRKIHYSVSMGASLFPEHGNDAQTLIINSDMAMYYAKKKGIDQWHIYDINDERATQLKQDHSIMLLVREALIKDKFSLLYQPILNIQNGNISHYEALIRLNNREGEFISPGIFIPLAEQTGEIRKIDEWVIDHALQELHELTKDQENARFSINISAPTLQSHDFPEMLFGYIEKYKVRSENIMIELTETAYIENFNQVLDNLNSISRRGVLIALDDFGVGFSSFNYLKMMPLNYIKLDGSYVKNLVKNKNDQVFVQSITAMVKAFGMRTIGEFVEEEETLTMLGSLGVSHAQGYYIGRPESLSDLIKNRNFTKFA